MAAGAWGERYEETSKDVWKTESKDKFTLVEKLFLQSIHSCLHNTHFPWILQDPLYARMWKFFSPKYTSLFIWFFVNFWKYSQRSTHGQGSGVYFYWNWHNQHVLFARDLPGFSTEGPVSWEIPQSQTTWDNLLFEPRSGMGVIPPDHCFGLSVDPLHWSSLTDWYESFYSCLMTLGSPGVNSS